MKPNQLALIEKYLDNDLNLEALRRVKILVETDHDFRVALAEAVRMRGLFHANEHDDYETLIDTIQLNIEALEPESLEENIINMIPPKPARGRKFFYLAVAAQFMILPIIWLLFFSSSFQSEMSVIGQITEKSGGAFIVRDNSKKQIHGKLQITSGDQLFVEENSQVTFVFNDGTNINFSAGSYASIVENRNGKKLTLYSGEIEADVKKQPAKKPMLILTEHAKAEVIGTKFSFSSSDYSSLLDVKNGAVRITRLKDRQSVLVKTKEYAVTGNESKRFAAERSDDPAYRSQLITSQTPGHKTEINIDISRARKLYLVVNNGGDNNRFDHAVWIAPKLVGPEGILDLTEYKWAQAKSGCFSTRLNKGFWGEKLKVNKLEVSKGIATHATSVITFDVPEGYTHFQATGAILDSGINQPDSCASMIFEVYTEIPQKKLQQLLIRRHHY